MNSAKQLPLLPEIEGQPLTPPAPDQRPAPALTARAPLAEALHTFENAMVLKGFTRNTITAFRADLRILCEFIPPSRPIGKIGTRDLQDFLTYLVRERGRPCKPKSYARRLTTIKVFFNWLYEEGILPRDPAAPLVHPPVQTPLPRVLSEGQIAQVRETAQRLAQGDKPDSRPRLLFELLLHTGIKKTECMNIHLADIDITHPDGPILRIRYPQVRQKYKERTLKLPPELVPLLREYRVQYQPAEHLFECTARNLEYVLNNLAQLAGIDGGISFEMMRWTAALRDYQAGMDETALRHKLGLSKLRWRETLEKLQRLAQPAL
ncbi:MAG: tyrosine-type recombinase/integrase [Anaerolineae bacterium]